MRHQPVMRKIRLNDNVAPGGYADYIPVRTRTGNKIHLVNTGSSVTLCGHWMKINATRMYVSSSEITCEKCQEYMAERGVINQELQS